MARMFSKLAGYRISKAQARRLAVFALFGCAAFYAIMYGYLKLIVVIVEKVVL